MTLPQCSQTAVPVSGIGVLVVVTRYTAPQSHLCLCLPVSHSRKPPIGRICAIRRSSQAPFHFLIQTEPLPTRTLLWTWHSCGLHKPSTSSRSRCRATSAAALVSVREHIESLESFVIQGWWPDSR